MGKSTISMAIFHCYVSSPEGNIIDIDAMEYHLGGLERPHKLSIVCLLCPVGFKHANPLNIVNTHTSLERPIYSIRGEGWINLQ